MLHWVEDRIAIFEATQRACISRKLRASHLDATLCANHVFALRRQRSHWQSSHSVEILQTDRTRFLVRTRRSTL